MAFEIITLPQGDSFARGYSSLQDEFGVVALSLAAWNFVFTLKANQSDLDAAALLSIVTAQMTINNTTGQVGFTVTPAQLSALTLGTAYYYAFKAKSPGGFVGTLDEGLLTLTASARKIF
jgi:hypothetical protein